MTNPIFLILRIYETCNRMPLNKDLFVVQMLGRPVAQTK